MEVSQEIFDQLEAYLAGELVPAEKKELESRLESQPELKAELDLIQNMQLGVEAAIIREKLNHIHERLDESKPRVRRFPPALGFGLAATILILLSVLLIFQQRSSQSPEELFAQFYQTDPGLPSRMGQSEDLAFAEAMLDFKERQYSSALSGFQQLAVSQPQNDSLLYYQAMCQIELQQAENAITLLEGISPQNHRLYPKAQWYMALVLLNQDQTEKAEQIIDPIKKDSSHPFHSQAILLSDQLNKD